MTTFILKSMRPLTASELEARERLKEMTANQLPAVRRSAERWRTGAGLSGGAVAVASLLTAPDVLSAASQLQREQGLTVLTITVVLALAAIGCGLRASVGWPAMKSIASARALQDWEQREVNVSIWCLRISMALTVATLAAAALAGAVMMFGLDLGTFQLVRPALAATPILLP